MEFNVKRSSAADIAQSIQAQLAHLLIEQTRNPNKELANSESLDLLDRYVTPNHCLNIEVSIDIEKE